MNPQIGTVVKFNNGGKILVGFVLGNIVLGTPNKADVVATAGGQMSIYKGASQDDDELSNGTFAIVVGGV
jgi:hypothetical protein